MRLPSRLALDSNCLIYGFDAPGSPRSDFIRAAVFAPLAAGEMEALTSLITLTELLVQPFERGLPERARELRAALEGLPGFSMVPVDADIASEAARIRGMTGLRVPDAIQVATAIVSGAAAVLTNDGRIGKAAVDIEVVVLDHLLGR